jgi:hypothetical protein
MCFEYIDVDIQANAEMRTAVQPQVRFRLFPEPEYRYLILEVHVPNGLLVETRPLHLVNSHMLCTKRPHASAVSIALGLLHHEVGVYPVLALEPLQPAIKNIRGHHQHAAAVAAR